jgi:hypothetical protein
MPTALCAFRVPLLAAVSALLGVPVSAQTGSQRATTIKPGESCPPGMTEVRPRNCMPPEDAQLLEVIAPYERFLEPERSKLERGLEALRGAQKEVANQERRVGEAFPEEELLAG